MTERRTEVGANRVAAGPRPRRQLLVEVALERYRPNRVIGRQVAVGPKAASDTAGQRTDITGRRFATAVK